MLIYDRHYYLLMVLADPMRYLGTCLTLFMYIKGRKVLKYFTE